MTPPPRINPDKEPIRLELPACYESHLRTECEAILFCDADNKAAPMYRRILRQLDGRRKWIAKMKETMRRLAES